MKCPVCRKDARAHIIHCVACGKYVHEVCWQEHMETEHKEK